MKKKILSFLLALVLVLGILPVSARAESGVTSEWFNFRNSTSNMAITTAETPTDASHTKLKWAIKLTQGWSGAGPQVIVGDYVYTQCGTVLYKLNKTTGAVEASLDLGASSAYGTTPMTYSEETGLLYIPLNGGIVKAVLPSAMSCAWTSTASTNGSGSQSQSEVVYQNGCIVTGFWKSSGNGDFVCLDASTGETKWEYSIASGFYWAGAVAVGDKYVVVGTEADSEGNGKLLAFDVTAIPTEENPINPVAELSVSGAVRSSIAWDGSNAYFTTKAGKLYSVPVNASTGSFGEAKSGDLGEESTSTPVVYGNYIYVGSGSGFNKPGHLVILNKADLTVANKIEMKDKDGKVQNGSVQGSLLLSTQSAGTDGYLYIYATYNYNPGGVALIKVNKDDPTDAASTALYVPDSDKQNYCTASVICDVAGNLYYNNDSGNVFCLTKTVAEIPTITTNLSTTKVKYAQSNETQTVEALTIAAKVSDGGTLTYQWQSSTDGATFTDIEGATGTSYTPSKETVGTTYYRCVVTNTKDDASESAISEAAPVEVKEYFSSNVGLSVVTSTSNSIKSGTQTVSATCGTYVFENYSGARIWLAADDSEASITKVERVSYTGSDVSFTSVTSNNEYDSRKYGYRFFKSKYSGSAIFRVTVTAENGSTGIHTIEITADADYAQEQSEDIYVTIEKAGEVEVAMQPVKAVDLNCDGKYSVDEVLYAAHEAYYEGGAAAGYGSYVSAYGGSISKLWGVENAGFGYWNNNNSCWSLGDEVKAGDYVYAFVYADQTGWSDAYTYFDSNSYSGNDCEEIDLSLKTATYNYSTYSYDFSAFAGANISVYDSNMTAITATDWRMVDNGDGTYGIWFRNAGTYKVVASKTDNSITPAVTIVTVADGPKTDTEQVYVTIEKAGTVEIPNVAITATDVNFDGKINVDEVLYAAHEKFYDGGAAAGYASYVGSWGLSVSKLWGDESGWFGYWVNNVFSSGLGDEVKENDHVYAFVYAITTYPYDAYACFSANAYEAKQNTGLTVTLKKAGYDSEWNTVFTDYADADVKAYSYDADKNVLTELSAADYSAVDNGDGTYTLNFRNEGTYKLIGSKSDNEITPAVADVTVKAGSVPSSVVIPVTSSADGKASCDVKMTATVKDQYGQPVSGVTVSFSLEDGTVIGTAETDSEGKATASVCYDIAGTYKVTASVASNDKCAASKAAVSMTLNLSDASVEFIQGMNQTVESGSDATFAVDGNIDRFVELKIDGETVKTSNYTKKKGSTIITLKGSYVATLSNGKHTITAVYKNGSCSTSFTVKSAAASTSDKAESGTKILGAENGFGVKGLIIMLGAAILLAGAAVLLLQKRRREN